MSPNFITQEVRNKMIFKLYTEHIKVRLSLLLPEENEKTMQSVFDIEYKIFIAYYMGNTRLIDNI